MNSAEGKRKKEKMTIKKRNALKKESTKNETAAIFVTSKEGEFAQAGGITPF